MDPYLLILDNHEDAIFAARANECPRKFCRSLLFLARDDNNAGPLFAEVVCIYCQS